MEIFEEKDYASVSRKAANIISAQIIQNPKSLLGLATGSSPIGTYKQLVEWYKKGDLDFSQVKSVNLDEYLGLSADDPNSYHYFMRQQLFDCVNIDINNTHVPDGLKAVSNPVEVCTAYDNLIQNLGGIDLQLLGLGHNCHIGFNEPADSFPAGTHIVDLTQNTIDANSRLFNCIEDVPTRAITMGIKNIMSAKRILLVVSGSDKAEALQKALYGPITPTAPASILQLHEHVTIVADTAALSLC